jgi:hypothetical protein
MPFFDQIRCVHLLETLKRKAREAAAGEWRQ